jgi:hypothetical protein
MVHIEFTITRRRLTILVGILLAGLMLVPGVAGASHTFEDVDDDNVFHDDIDWLAAAGVTKGCNPPANDKFCPGSNVTREQMAAFMHRLATGRVVDAATAVTASNANDADKLDGMDSSEFVHKGETSAGGRLDIPASAFTAARPDRTGWRNYSIDGIFMTEVTVGVGARSFTAPVSLPQGATVTAVRMHVADSSLYGYVLSGLMGVSKTSFDTGVDLVELPQPSGFAEPGISVFESTDIANAVIDNDSYYYSASVLFDLWEGPTDFGDLGFYGLEVDYTMP